MADSALKVDHRKCTGCIECEVLVPGFISANHGLIILSDAQVSQKYVRRAAADVVESCPQSAISFGPYSG